MPPSDRPRISRPRRWFMANCMLLGNLAANVVGMAYVKMLPLPQEMGDMLPRMHYFGVFNVWFPVASVCMGLSWLLWYELPMRRTLGRLFQGEPPEQGRLSQARRRMLNEPYAAMAADSLLWLVAAILVYSSLRADAAPEFLVRALTVRTLLTGMMTMAVAFFLLEHQLQHMLAPIFFPQGGLAGTPRVLRISIGARLAALVFVVAVVPLTAVLLTTVGYARQLGMLGISPEGVLANLQELLLKLCAMGLVSAVVLTGLVRWSITQPLKDIGSVVRRVQEGDFSARVQVISNDELGMTGDAINQMTDGLKDREKIKEAFGRYVTQEVRDHILSGDIPLDGEVKHPTLLFTDLRDFTPMVEATQPKEVVRTMNQYFAAMEQAIAGHQGLVLQYVGDEIEAVFGAPLEVPGHQDLAVRCALEMRRRLAELNNRLAAEGLPTLRHGIGVHTGQVLAANIGSPERLSYALVGDTVNLASRIQNLNKEFGTDILVSAATVEGLTGSYPLEEMPLTTVKGKSRPVVVYTLR